MACNIGFHWIRNRTSKTRTTGRFYIGNLFVIEISESLWHHIIFTRHRQWRNSGRVKNFSYRRPLSPWIVFTAFEFWIVLFWLWFVLQMVKRHQLQPHAFADDTQICGFCQLSAVDSLCERVCNCVDDVSSWMRPNRQPLNNREDRSVLVLVFSASTFHFINYSKNVHTF